MFQEDELKMVHNFSQPQMQDGPIKIGKGRLWNSVVRLNTFNL